MREPAHPIVIDSDELAVDFSSEFWPSGSGSVSRGITLPKGRIIAAEGGLLTGTARPGLTHMDVNLRHLDTGVAFGLFDNYLTVLGEDKIPLDIPVDNRWEVYVNTRNYAATVTVRASVFLEVGGI